LVDPVQTLPEVLELERLLKGQSDRPYRCPVHRRQDHLAPRHLLYVPKARELTRTSDSDSVRDNDVLLVIEQIGDHPRARLP
jgi:hypothetical protein